MIILKFGGSSIKDSSSIKNISSIIQLKQKSENIAVVLSAMGEVTNKLTELAELSRGKIDFGDKFKSLKRIHEECIDELALTNTFDRVSKHFEDLNSILSIIPKNYELYAKFLDRVLCYGEILSTTIVSDYLTKQEISNDQLITTDLIITDNNFGRANVHFEQSYYKIKDYFKSHKRTQIITGFIGSTVNKDVTTLGRNGSNYTATLIGSAINADSIEIWSNVDGVLSTNPKFTKEARTIPQLTYEEALELANSGTEILFSNSIIPLLDKHIPIKIKNSLNPMHTGTKILNKIRSENPIVGISSIDELSIVKLKGNGFQYRRGNMKRIFSTLTKSNINIRLISQNYSEQSIWFVIDSKWNKITTSALKKEFSFELKHKYLSDIIIEENFSMVAIIGKGIQNRLSNLGKIFSILGKIRTNIIAILPFISQLNISFIIHKKDLARSIKSLHHELVLNRNVQNLFIVGHGLVGKNLIKLIREDKKINLCGLINSKKMLLNNCGLNTNDLNEMLAKGMQRNLNIFIKTASLMPNAIIVDATSSEEIADKTNMIIKKGISVVTASKLANSKNQKFYEAIRKNALIKEVHFKYGANVGAGLPIIETLQDLIKTGDEIIKIEGIMSGTLSFLFSQYDGTIPFSTLVSQAREKGFTEPDPRNDLNGMDVARKILILARETKANLELKDISIESLVPKGFDDKLSIKNFLIKLSELDNDILIKYQEAIRKNEVLKYLASWNGKNAVVGLKSIGMKSAFYQQSGIENIIVFKTKRYNEIPLVIKGHGAGAEVTAAAILKDIISCKN